MGSALDYYMNSLTINGKRANSKQVSYDEMNHVLTIMIPDEEKIVLEYEATVNLPVGDDNNALNETNAYNKCSLRGKGNVSEFETRVNLKGKVFESSGSSTGKGVSIKLYKCDKNDQTDALEKAKFSCSEVTYDSNFETTATKLKAEGETLPTGYLTFSGLSRNVLYRIIETEAPDNYKLDATPHYFIFKGNSEENYPEAIKEGDNTYPVTLIDKTQAMHFYTISNEKGTTKENTIEISKIDAQTKSELKNAHLSIINKDTNETVKSWITGENNNPGKVKLEPGTYVLKETKAPEGYMVADDITFVVDNDGNIVGNDQNTIIMEDKHIEKGKLILTKTVEGNISKENAKKITFKVMNQETKKTDKYTLDDFSYDEVNKIWTKELDVLAGEYTVEETNSSIEDYTVKTTFIINGQEVEGKKTESIQIEDQGKGNVAFKNSYTPKLYEVSIRKQDILNNEDIEGASLQIQNKDTGEIISIDSSKDGQKVNLGYGNYSLTEITAPDGYKIANPIEFVVTKDGKVKINDKVVNEVIMKDQPIGKLVITKTIQGNLSKEQIGDSIKFEVTQNDTQKSHIYSLNDFIYDGNRWILELEENTGGYTVKELVDDIHGYTLVKTIYMIGNEVNEGKSVDVDVEKVTTATVAFENTYELTTYDVKVDKVDKENDEKIAGAELKVINQANEEIAHWITDGKNSYNLKLVPGTYTLIEVNAPKGYEIAKPITFVVGKDGKVVDYQNNKIIMKDKAKPGKLVIAKIVKGNISKEQAEKSIKFEVIDKDTQDKKVYSLNDFEYDENSGKWMLELTKVAGKYTVKELTDDVQGYKLTHIVSIIDGKEKGDVAANLNVEKDETTTIEYTNNYEENKIETKENKSDQTPKQESKKAKTGDDTQILENLMLLISSLGGILFGLRFYRRKNEF